MKKIFTLLFVVSLTFYSHGQKSDGLNLKNDLSNGAKKNKTANRWDAFGNFIQVAGNDITSDKKGIQFKGVLFPLFSLDSVKSNSSKYYLKRTWMRNSEIQGGVTLANDNSISGINFGYNYAILNMRDKSRQDFYFQKETIIQDILLNTGLKFVEGWPLDKKLEFTNITLRNYTDNGKIASNDSVVMKEFIKILNDSIKKHPELNSQNYAQAVKFVSNIYDSLSEIVARRPLWTVNPTIQYNPIIGKVNGITGTTELVFGLGKHVSRKPWEFDLKLDYTFGDTIPNKSNLKRQVLISNVGINKVLMTESDKKTSFIEFKFGGEMDVVTGGLKDGEEQYKYFAKTTLRIRASKSIWIPLTLKYDPKTSNLFGFLNININIDKDSKDDK